MIFNLVIKLLFYFSTTAGLIMYLPGLLDIHPKAFHSSLPKSLSTFRSIEAHNVSHFEQFDELFAPESIAVHNGRLVTGSSDGYLYEIKADNTFKPLLKIIKEECTAKDRRSGKECARPLGLNFDSKGVLFVVEASSGVYKVENVFGGQAAKVTQVFDIQQTAVLGRGSLFLDDVAVEEKSSGGHILYISDVSTRYTVSQCILTLFASDKGRIVRYDTESKQVTAIATDLFIPNGVELTLNNEALLFTEFASRNVYRYKLKGAKAGSLEKIVHQLPGEPDKIRRSQSGKTFWIGLLKPRTLLKPTNYDYYMKKPLLRRLIARVAHLSGNILEKVAQLMKNEQLEELAYSLKTLQILASAMFRSDGGMMLEIDADGNTINSIYSDNEDFGLISEVREVPSAQSNQRIFYLGSSAMPNFRKLVITK